MNCERPSNAIIICTAIVIALGIFLRIYPSAGSMGRGFDENLYCRYVRALEVTGLGNYAKLSKGYIDAQSELPSAILPPTRFFYIYCGYLWHALSGTHTNNAAEDEERAIDALHHVSTTFTILTLLLSTVFAARLAGPKVMLGVAALMACAPTQIHMSQHALIDGVFAFWALLAVWLLWENLQAPNHAGWLTAYGVSLIGLVLTKENAAFATAALLAVIIANRWLKFGRVTIRLLLATFAAPAIGLLILFALAGGPLQFVQIYQLLVAKAYTLDYAIKFCDGPWYRYLVDLLLVSPLVFLLAIGELFQLNREKKTAIYLVTFVAASYLLMSNVKYSLNLRYANMWDMPLRFLAFSQLATLCAPLRRYKMQVLVGLVVLLCLFELNQYRIFFINYKLYELVSEGLLRAVKIVK